MSLYTDGAIIDSDTIGQTTGRLGLGYDSTNTQVKFLATDDQGRLKVAQQGFSQYYGEAQTPGAGGVTAITYAVPTNSTVNLQLNVRSLRADNSIGACLRKEVTVKNTGGVLVFVGAIINSYTARTSTENCTFTISGTNILCQVFGTAATVLNWQTNLLVYKPA